MLCTCVGRKLHKIWVALENQAKKVRAKKSGARFCWERKHEWREEEEGLFLWFVSIVAFRVSYCSFTSKA